ncbi:unnamed protein product [Vitrella brassicaformis CCMP3155]|uniref:Uncharacterized protein n=1 Tax=Vitrella brassicaformis (strain CCMP3155) TaxID=1169540 RepID=A0A0G4GT41_VITBC|nr:unnamed protein product [Vitrella brassicaformis CCMP3155]|eukprot:CEM33861.1 unnamed protein product [Vitrella brassicaformis CCMP3155]
MANGELKRQERGQQRQLSLRVQVTWQVAKGMSLRLEALAVADQFIDGEKKLPSGQDGVSKAEQALAEFWSIMTYARFLHSNFMVIRSLGHAIGWVILLAAWEAATQRRKQCVQ